MDMDMDMDIYIYIFHDYLHDVDSTKAGEKKNVLRKNYSFLFFKSKYE